MRALVLFAVVASGCAHQTTFTSTPSGADVIIDGETVGQTPLVWDQPLSGEEEREVVVKKGDQSATVHVVQTGFSGATIASFMGGCVGTPLGMWLVGGIGAGLVVTFLPAAWPVLFVAIPVALVGTCGWVPGLVTAVILTFVFGRAGPDTVSVDLTTGAVKVDPVERTRGPASTPEQMATMRY
jgi:hypothetical protein